MKKFLVSKSLSKRSEFINNISGRKIAIFNNKSELLNQFDIAIDMNLLMKDDYFLSNLSKCDGNTTIVLLDVLVKNGIYVHPFGRIYKFCETARDVFIIDSFAFKWDERQIVRPFLFMNPSILGSSLITFMQEENNTVESYFTTIRDYIESDVLPVQIEIVKYYPTQSEINDYEMLKKDIILEKKYPKAKIVTSLIKYVDGLNSKKEAISKVNSDAFKVLSNLPKNKFAVYQNLSNPDVNKVLFFSSGIFGADEIELKKTMIALERHNLLIELLNGTKKL